METTTDRVSTYLSSMDALADWIDDQYGDARYVDHRVQLYSIMGFYLEAMMDEGNCPIERGNEWTRIRDNAMVWASTQDRFKCESGCGDLATFRHPDFGMACESCLAMHLEDRRAEREVLR